MKRPLERIFATIGLMVAALFLLAVARDQQVEIAAPSPPPPPGQEFSIVVLPDTQVYAQFFPEIFMAQTAWIAEHKKDRNIAYVIQEGDIVNIYDAEDQWRAADAALGNLDGVVPYGLAPGNHDFSPDGKAPLYKKYFPMSRIQRSGGWGGSYPGDFQNTPPQYDKNSYQLFTAGGAKYIAFNLEFCPPDGVIDWVGLMLMLHPDHRAILTTHTFTDFRGLRSDKNICKFYGSEGDNAGTEIWDKLVLGRNYNIFLFLSGHDITTTQGAARRVDEVDGRKIHQILANYQQLHRGGNGYLRIMTFKPASQTIQVETYSPYLDNFMSDPANRFELKL